LPTITAAEEQVPSRCRGQAQEPHHRLLRPPALPHTGQVLRPPANLAIEVKPFVQVARLELTPGGKGPW